MMLIHVCEILALRVRKTQRLGNVHCLSTNPVLAFKYLLK